MSKNVVFINPPLKNKRKLMRNFDCATESKGNYFLQPYDFLLLSAKVPKEWNFSFIDCIAEDINSESLISRLQSNVPDIVVMALADSSWDDDFQTLQSLNELINSDNIYLFGDAFFDAHTSKKVAPFCNGLIASPYTFSFKKLNTVSTYNNTPSKTLEKFSIGIPRHEHFLNSAYRWPFSKSFKYTTVFISWGCPYSCEYCIMSQFPNFVRSEDEIYDEINYIVKELKINEIYIGDRSFGLPKDLIFNLLNKIISNNLKFNWSCYFHPNQYDEELLNLMKKSGCHTIIIGIESKDLSFLKNFKRHCKEGHLEKLLSQCRNLNIKVCADFIFGLPGQSKQEILDTINYSRSIPIDYASFNIAAPLAGTNIRELAKQKLNTKNIHHYDSLGKSNVVSVCDISANELIQLRNLAVKKFYFRWNYLLKRVLSIRTTQQFIIQFQEMLGIFKKAKD